ncbi:DUF4184 family protein [Streptosporangium sp. NPDC051023]|uniref:DUF4184 family protein n=1 Tax=Streptosporangium sp. NPDC051023 TaxID=3155410 RepID=UPI00344C9580
MPFTPSHVAAVLPLISSARIRRFLDPWALALGTMVPDLPIFFSFLPDYGIWHSLRGVVTLDLFAVVVLLAVFHGLLRDPLTALLPASLAGKAASLAPEGYGLRRLPAVVAGGVLGSLTHLLWDSFTHSYSLEVWGWAWLAAPVVGPLPVFRVLQYVSTVVGLAAVLWWSRRGLSRMEPVALPERLALPVLVRRGVILATMIATLMGAAAWPRIYPPSSRAELITRLGAGMVVGFCALLIAYAVMWQLRRVMAVFQGA